MARHALSDEKKKQNYEDLREKYMLEAIDATRAEQNKDPGEKKKSLRAICEDMEKKCLREKKKAINLDHNTLSRRVKGERSIREANQDKAWLTPQETEEVIEYAISLANRGFPLSHRRLKEHVDEICRAHYGAAFPEKGVGKQWTNRFVTKHSARLQSYWSHPLESARGRAVNENTKEEYFKLLKSALDGIDSDGLPISPDLIYGTDETGIQQGIGTRERVFGPAKQSVQHQQRSGTRENITVIVTICADGTSLAPSVIYKGECFQASWHQDNPLNAS